jgi:hypothetical protein
VCVPEPPRPSELRKWDRLHRWTSQRLRWTLEKGWQLRDESAA